LAVVAQNHAFLDMHVYVIQGAVVRSLGAGVVSSLTGRRPVLEALAKLLMEHEVVDRTMLLTLLETPAPSDARVGPPLVAHR
jgi:hypothetical protein